MQRRYRLHDLRRVYDLAGVWDFAYLGDADVDSVNPAAIDFNDHQAVPGCFDATPTYAGLRGVGAYCTTIRLRRAGHHRLVIDGLHHWGRVYINGRAVCDHVGGFTQFAIDWPDAPEGESELVILADNRLDYQRCPLHLDYFDWYHYGGITRGVEVHDLGKAWIDSAVARTADLESRTVALHICCGAETDTTRPLSVHWQGRGVARQDVQAGPEGAEVFLRFSLDGAELWSQEAPNLQELYLQFGDDDLRIRTGLREIREDGPKLLLNNEPLTLLGFCRHEAHPEFGHAVGPQIQLADLQLLRDMGCNFIRGSHYPQDPHLLDLCDEMGMLVWNEAIGWNQTTEHLTDEHYIRAQMDHIDEMVAMSINHPSIILWGVQNESRTDDAAVRPAFERMFNRLRELDPTRPVTYAIAGLYKDQVFDLADVVSVNDYPGWYHHTIEEIPQCLDEISEYIDAEGRTVRPLIISEMGAGAIYGWRDRHETRWSEQYQSRLLETVIRHLFLDRDRACGFSIWQYGDMRTSEQVTRALGRPRDFNNKGVVDEYRRPKQAYWTVRDLFRRIRGLED